MRALRRRDGRGRFLPAPWVVNGREIKYLDPARDDEEQIEAMLDALWNARALLVFLAALPLLFLAVLLWLR